MLQGIIILSIFYDLTDDSIGRVGQKLLEVVKKRYLSQIIEKHSINIEKVKNSNPDVGGLPQVQTFNLLYPPTAGNLQMKSKNQQTRRSL